MTEPQVPHELYQIGAANPRSAIQAGPFVTNGRFLYGPSPCIGYNIGAPTNESAVQPCLYGWQSLYRPAQYEESRMVW
jgi:hypothetical protein